MAKKDVQKKPAVFYDGKVLDAKQIQQMMP